MGIENADAQDSHVPANSPLQRRRFRIQPRPPFAFDHILTFLRNSAGTVLEVITDDDQYQRALYLGGQPTLIVVRSLGLTEEPSIEVEIVASHIDEKIEAAARRSVIRTFAASVDVADLEAVFGRDPVIWKAWLTCRGFRPLVLPDLFETIVWAIISQQITVAFAAKCKRAFTEIFGGRFVVDGRDYLLFPRPELVATLAEPDLLALQFSRQKARYVLNLARCIVSGDFDPEALWSLPADEVVHHLCSLFGVGRWTAEYVLLRGLGYADSIPAGDVALQRTIGNAYFGRMATEAEVRTLGSQWAPWRSYAASCWWFSKQVDQVQKQQSRGDTSGDHRRLASPA